MLRHIQYLSRDWRHIGKEVRKVSGNSPIHPSSPSSYLLHSWGTPFDNRIGIYLHRLSGFFPDGGGCRIDLDNLNHYTLGLPMPIVGELPYVVEYGGFAFHNHTIYHLIVRNSKYEMYAQHQGLYTPNELQRKHTKPVQEPKRWGAFDEHEVHQQSSHPTVPELLHFPEQDNWKRSVQ